MTVVQSGSASAYDAPRSALAPKHHISGLDELRGVAIVAVILFHTLNVAPHTSILSNIFTHIAGVGWMGVDLFFVLSGFLITGILIDARSGDGYFRTFYARRVLRIVPVYIAFLCVCLSIGALAPKVQGWYWSYLVNVWLAVRGWADGPTHLWSLAVEEQFYLLWPIAVLYLSPRALSRAAIACFVGAELFRAAFVIGHAGGQVNYVLLPTRMDTLAVGAFLACAARDEVVGAQLARWGRRIVIAAFAALVLVGLVEHTIDFLNPLSQLLAYPAIAVLSGALVLRVANPSRPFASRPLRFLGRYSYGMYLWHWLVVSTFRAHTALLQPRLVGGSYVPYYLWAFAAVLGTTVIVALVSWYLLEEPFLRLKRFVPYARPTRSAVPVLH